MQVTGPIIFDLIGTELSAEERDILQHPLIGGVIYFARNYESKEQIKTLTQNIRKATTKNLLITVDQEGGRVQRFQKGMTRLPSMAQITRVYNEDPEMGLRFAHSAAWIMAAELLALGIDLSFAPVLDLDKGKNTVIGDRAFHADPDVVVTIASAFIAGMHAAGMAAIGKHFPGHGDVTVDSHIGMPVDDRELDAVMQTDMQPFIRLAPTLQGMMPAHIVYSRIDAKAGGFSSFWIQTMLRERLQFNGLVISDALDMKGAEVAGATYAERTQAALQAGCDMVLICNNRAGVWDALTHIEERVVAPLRLTPVFGQWQRLPLNAEQYQNQYDFFTQVMTTLSQPTLT